MFNELRYNSLDESRRKIYRRIYSMLTIRERRIYLMGGLNIEELFKIYFDILYDHPEFFYIRSSVSASYSSTSTYIDVEYIYDKAEIDRRQRIMNEEIEKIKKYIGKYNNEEYVVYKVSEYIAKKTSYAIDHKYNQNASAVLVNGIAQCSGYSQALKYVLDILGIECHIVLGDADGGDGSGYGAHAWNMVKVNGKYYHMDITFWDGYNGNSLLLNHKVYLFYPDDMIKGNHRWDSLYPKCTATDLYKAVTTGGIKGRSSGKAKEKKTDAPKKAEPKDDKPKKEDKAPKFDASKVTASDSFRAVVINALKANTKEIVVDNYWGYNKDTVDSDVRYAGIMCMKAFTWDVEVGSKIKVKITYKGR